MQASGLERSVTEGADSITARAKPRLARMTMSDLVIVTDDGPVRTVRMNRPDKKNALTLAMYDAMAAAIESAAEQSGAALPADRRRAARPSAPATTSAISCRWRAEAARSAQPIMRFLYALARCELPLVAAVQGNAVGVGTTMLMHCDHVVAASDARFSTPFVGLGLVPEAASSLIAPRLMGHARAFSLLVMGRPLNAEEAKAAGLVNTVVAPEAVEAEAMKAAREIAALPPQGVLRRAPADARLARARSSRASTRRRSCSRRGCNRPKRARPSRRS